MNISGIVTKTLVAGTLVASVGLGLTFTGSEVVNNVKSQLVDLRDKVLAYERNEHTLLTLISNLKSSADSVYNENKANKAESEAEIHRLEGELQTANNEVEELRLISEEIEQTTADKQPLTDEEISSIDTSIGDSDETPLPLDRLQLKLVNWLPDADYKAAHPELHWQEDGGNRVYGVTNPNDYDVDVSYTTGYETGAFVAKANSETLFLRQWDDGRMEINWVDKEGHVIYVME